MAAGPDATGQLIPARPAWRASRVTLGLFGIAALIALLHGPSVGFGLFMDDYAHYQQLAESDWSLRGLTDACRLELVGGVIEFWWIPDCTLRFFRPLSFGLMKLTYTLCGWDYELGPRVAHAVSLWWHFVACGLLLALLRVLGCAFGVAWLAVALFAIHPGHVATVQWIAAQTELLVTVFLLGATLCYARFRGWTKPARTPWAWGVAALVLFAAALGCRENAIMFPLVMLCVELHAWRTRREADAGATKRWLLTRFSLIGAALGVAVVYLGVRHLMLGGAALPPKPYIIPPGDPDFLAFVLDKTRYYLLGEFLLVPCVPIGGLAYFRDHALIFGLLTLAAIVLIAIGVWRAWPSRAAVLGPAALFGYMAPVLPAFESPHHLYLPSIGWALLIAGALGGFGNRAGRQANGPADQSGARRSARLPGLLMSGATLAFFGALTYFFSMALEAAGEVEDRVVDEVLTAPTPVRDGDTLYFVNLPMIAHYVKLAAEQRAGLHDLRVVGLCWSPRLLGVTDQSELRRVAPGAFEARMGRHRYFSGPFERLTRLSNAAQNPLDGDGWRVFAGYRVALRDRDEEGFAAIEFSLERPAGANGIHLFWGSKTRWAWQVPLGE